MSGPNVLPLRLNLRPATLWPSTAWSDVPQNASSSRFEQAQPPKISIDANDINSLSEKLSQWAWSNSNEGFNYAYATIDRVDSRIIALALLQIPNEVIVAQLLVPFKTIEPEKFKNIMLYLGAYGILRGNILYKKITPLIESIHISFPENLSGAEIADLKVRTLHLLAKQRESAAWPFLNGITGQYEGLAIVGVVQVVSGEQKGSFTIIINRGPTLLSKEEPHPAREMREYQDILSSLWNLEGILRVEEYAEPNGWLVVKTCFEESEYDHFFDEHGNYFLQISITY